MDQRQRQTPAEELDTSAGTMLDSAASRWKLGGMKPSFVAVEVNGPHHYIANGKGQVLGTDALRSMLVEFLGGELLRIPASDFVVRGQEMVPVESSGRSVSREKAV